jgi:hypothetical protein
MIERNFKNNIVFDDSIEDKLLLESRDDVFDQDLINKLFNTAISDSLIDDQEVLGVSVGVLIDASKNGNIVTISLLIEGTAPYSLTRDGTEIEADLEASDFPYEDSPSLNGEVCYVLEDSNGNSDENCVT